MLVPMELARIVINDIGDQQVVFLREIEGGRSFPILIGLLEAGAEADDQIELAFQLVLCRTPSSEERDLSKEFLRAQASLPTGDSRAVDDSARRSLEAFCLVLLNTNEFAYTR